MCGRYFLDAQLSDEELVRIVEALERRGAQAKLSGEVFPTDVAPVLANGQILAMRWGFSLPGGGQVINARSETFGQKPMFRAAGRCLIPASGYYEWGGEGRRKHAFSRPGETVYMAGLWRREQEEPLARFVILTRDASAWTRAVHPRMPVIFRGNARRAWLSALAPDAELLAQAEDMLRCRPAEA